MHQLHPLKSLRAWPFISVPTRNVFKLLWPYISCK